MTLKELFFDYNSIRQQSGVYHSKVENAVFVIRTTRKGIPTAGYHNLPSLLEILI